MRRFLSGPPRLIACGTHFLIDRAYHPELVDICANIVETQVAEITQMRTWLCEWYGVCNYGPKGAVAETH